MRIVDSSGEGTRSEILQRNPKYLVAAGINVVRARGASELEPIRRVEPRIRHDTVLAESMVLRTMNRGMARARRPATIQCGPMCLTAAIPARGRRFRFLGCGK